MHLTSMEYDVDPVPPGTCKRCAGYRRLKQQHFGSEVGYITCARCQGSGEEPKGLSARLKALFRSEPWDDSADQISCHR
jgi:hypothetical protein